jgi:hypothetical protein
LQAVEEKSRGRRVRDAVVGFAVIAAVAAALCAAVGWALLNLDSQSQAKGRQFAQLSTELEYAQAFSMRVAVCEPDSSELRPLALYGADADRQFTRVEYLLELPVESIREADVVYVAPTYDDGATAARLAALNDALAAKQELLEGSGLAHPLSLEDVVFRHEKVKAVLGKLPYGERTAILG